MTISYSEAKWALVGSFLQAAYCAALPDGWTTVRPPCKPFMGRTHPRHWYELQAVMTEGEVHARQHYCARCGGLWVAIYPTGLHEPDPDDARHWYADLGAAMTARAHILEEGYDPDGPLDDPCEYCGRVEDCDCPDGIPPGPWGLGGKRNA